MVIDELKSKTDEREYRGDGNGDTSIDTSGPDNASKTGSAS
jgi:hypothetical protein